MDVEAEMKVKSLKPGLPTRPNAPEAQPAGPVRGCEIGFAESHSFTEVSVLQLLSG